MVPGTVPGTGTLMKKELSPRDAELRPVVLNTGKPSSRGKEFYRTYQASGKVSLSLDLVRRESFIFGCSPRSGIIKQSPTEQAAEQRRPEQIWKRHARIGTCISRMEGGRPWPGCIRTCSNSVRTFEGWAVGPQCFRNFWRPKRRRHPVQGDEPGLWTFTDKWILRQAVKPYVTEELFLRKKLSYNAPPSRRADGDVDLVPLQIHLRDRITQENIERLGFFNWPHLENLLTTYLKDPLFPADGSLDTRAQILMYALSFVVLQERFNVPTWVP
ncbi:hypothetical protein C8R47DRAFT_1082151 [Mycena vitilis]|nr:hypothetical protein C8R47DRAFT_1082149 [Mycena vitilis]KAJ6457122.1 hypothetical protein C8R47DRAFT_1082150 [Mycena vitilis]KAJ6457123.1 hypothetical protein C8R47DRAFT_1082151 [Mycena vitilis]